MNNYLVTLARFKTVLFSSPRQEAFKSSLPGPSRRLAPVIKCNAFVSFQSYIVRDISLTEIYRWLVTFGVRWDISLVHWNLIRHFEKHEVWRRVKRKIIAFGNDTFPNLYDVLVYERKLESEYLERQIYEPSPKSEPSIVKLFESKSDLSKLSTLSEHLSRIKANTYQS